MKVISTKRNVEMARWRMRSNAKVRGGLRIYELTPPETVRQDTLLSFDTADLVSRGLRLETFQRGGRRGAIDDVVACCQPGKDFQIDIGRVMNQVAIIAEIVSNFLHRAKVVQPDIG